MMKQHVLAVLLVGALAATMAAAGCTYTAQPWSQCGGSSGTALAKGVDGPWNNFCCAGGSKCVRLNRYYHQCQLKKGAKTPTPKAPLPKPQTANNNPPKQRPENDEAGGTPVAVVPKAIKVNGGASTFTKTTFVKGANLPWNKYGWDFGTHPQWGAGYDGSAFDAAFKAMSGTVDVVRIFIFTDGRAAPEFDDAKDRGFVLAVEPKFWTDVDDMLDRAAKYGIKVMACLWDFHAMHNGVADNGGGMRGSLFSNVDNTDAFMQRVMKPMAARYADHPGLWGYDIINEPEWAMKESLDPQTEQVVSANDIFRFVGKAASIIHRYSPKKLVTVGSAAMKWMCTDKSKWCVDNFYSDDYIIAATGGDRLAYLDVWQVHYYDWMFQTFDPFFRPRDAMVPLDKPLFVGEAYGMAWGKYKPADMLSLACKNKYNGVMFWAYQQGGQFGSWATFGADLAKAQCDLTAAT